MRKILFILCLALSFSTRVSGQSSFDYSVELVPISISGLPGLHSYTWAQHDGKWLILGGRLDGIHARQPFNAFPQSDNNTELYVVDINTLQFWSAPINTLPIGISEQLQSTNMNFYQDNDTLYIIGGYAFSETMNDHITFPNLTSLQISPLIDAIVNGLPIEPYFKQITDENFAVNGGHLGKIGNTFYLIGGHRFDGRYNPMGMPSYTQTYTNEIRKFKINNSGAQLSYADYTAITDPIHLRRRDYNLLPQIFPDGSEGYTISSGVFQINVDLPFLYPVDITETGYNAITSFNQYLNNYHSAFSCLWDSTANEMHTLFFGGISQYYYENGIFMMDDLVPFVKTISRLTRHADGSLEEFQLPIEMPAFLGASAEFIPYPLSSGQFSEIIRLNNLSHDTTLIGHIYGGILSADRNPFSSNQTNTTNASPGIYAVNLIKNQPLGIHKIDGENPYKIKVFPNPAKKEVSVDFTLKRPVDVFYFVTTANGQITEHGQIQNAKAGLNTKQLQLDDSATQQTLVITFVFDNRFFVTEKVVRN